MNIEQTLILMKPDAVKRGIVGEILHRFERAGLKIVGAKMVAVDREFAKKHYPVDDAYLKSIGEKSLSDYKKFGIDTKAEFGSDDLLVIGKQVWNWNLDFLTSGPILAIVLEGMSAISNVRMMVGNTRPADALPGTIRGDFALDTAIGANIRKRSLYNLMHASGDVEEAKREINLWFKENELVSYRSVHEDLYNY